MILIIEILIFAAITALAYFVMSRKNIPSSKPSIIAMEKEEKLKTRKRLAILSVLAIINRPLPKPFKEALYYKLSAAKMSLSPEEFLLIKELIIIGSIWIFLFAFGKLPLMAYAVLIIVGYVVPDLLINAKIKGYKKEITKALPDAIDLLSLCVGAGLDFMLAIKWVVEKSSRNLLIDELGMLMQEINLGKPRKTALLDLAKKYEIEELSTFSRTLVQADRMGTSVADALNILAEDMRLSRFRRGEQMALKAPLKMLIPLLLCIFPVVGIIIGGPILLQFMQQKPFGF
jgi:tight adherence protein C